MTAVQAVSRFAGCPASSVGPGGSGQEGDSQPKRNRTHRNVAATLSSGDVLVKNLHDPRLRNTSREIAMVKRISNEPTR